MSERRYRGWNPFRRDQSIKTAEQSAATTAPTESSPVGLKVEIEGREPIVDIIVVHGLNGHREETWTASNGMHWPRDLIPTDIPNARVLSWGYDANTHGDRVSCMYLYDHARQLVSDLCLQRNLTQTTTRPIIFVAHSLGGIVVKSALIHADAAREGALKEHRSIKTSTYGIIFMGTPHQGGTGVQLGKLLANIASVFIAADTRLLQHLERDSEWLQQQLGQYGLISGDFVTKFAYEVYKTRTVAGPLLMVVPRASAVVPGAADVEPIAIHADHLTMVKFQSRDDGGYKTVSGQLQLMVRDAKARVSLRWEAERRTDIARLNLEDHFTVPFSLAEIPDTTHFVGRERELKELHTIFHQDCGRKIVVVHGLGGMGKTQLAVAYAKRYKTKYPAIFWLNIRDENALKQSLQRMVGRIEQQYPDQLGAIAQDSNLQQTADAIKAWLGLAKNTQWLVIFDNYDNPKMAGNQDPAAVDIRQFLPEADHGSIIVTTRSSQVEIGHQISLKKLTNMDECIKILSERSGWDTIVNDPGAKELAKELDGLPLALTTARAYLKETSVTYQDYQRLYKESWLQLQQTTPELTSYEDRAMYSTWNVSWQYVEQQSNIASQLLRFWAYFDSQDLWYELLREGRLEGHGWLASLTKNEVTFTHAMRLLCNVGLAEANNPAGIRKEQNGYSMHGCVHAWVVHVLNDTWNVEQTRLALISVARHLPDRNSSKYWLGQQRLMQHVARSWAFVIEGMVGDEEELAWAIHEFGDTYSDQGKMQEAKKMYQRALRGYEKVWGPDHTSTLDTVNALGDLYLNQDRLEKAGKMYKRALRGKEEVWGPNHTSTLDTVNNLGGLYWKQGRMKKAGKMYERALRGKEEVWGPNHTSTLATVNNLGILYKDQGRMKKAEKMFQRALRGYKKVWGLNHTSTLATVNNLGRLYTSQGEMKKAEKMFLQALQGYKKVWGLNHTLTLGTVNSLGILYVDQNKMEEAEEMFQQALQGCKKVLGPEHIYTLNTANNLPVLYADQGKMKEAVEMFKQIPTWNGGNPCEI